MKDGEVMDGWSVRQAWSSLYKTEEFPPKLVDPDDGKFSDVDHVVASFFGAASEENLKKAHTAIRAVYPRLVLSQLPPSGHHGQALKNHIVATTVKAMKDYRKEAGVSLKDIREDISCIETWEFDCISDWFYIWDALGSTGVNVQDSDMADFYQFASLRLRYGDWS